MLTPPYWWKGVYLLNHLKLDGAPLPVTARASEKSLAELTGVRKPLALNADVVLNSVYPILFR